MDSSENERYKMDHYKGAHHQWNMMPQHQVKKPNALAMNKKIMAILTERDTAIRELNIALAEKKEALAARDEALQQRDEALAQLDTALMERDNAIAALKIQDQSANFPYSSDQHGTKRMHHSNNLASVAEAPYKIHITDALPITEISSEAVKSSQRKRAKNVGDDLYRQVSPEGRKYRSEWESQDADLNIVNFDEITMPTPVCSCTGAPRLCYKWGNGGWQSSCCTTTMSVYPLPQMPNKRHARVGGRKMSGSVFTRLLSRLVAEGHDLSLPVDLKDYWARHGTNRYITIK